MKSDFQNQNKTKIAKVAFLETLCLLQLHQITLSLCVWFAKIIPLSLFRFFSGNPHICRLNFTFQFNVGATLTVVWLRAVKDSPGCKSGQKSQLTLYFCVLLGSTWNGVKIGYIEQNCVFCLLLFNCEIILDRIHSVFRGWQRWRPLFHLHRWRCCCQSRHRLPRRLFSCASSHGPGFHFNFHFPSPSLCTDQRNEQKIVAVGRVRTYAGRAHWISSPTP